MIFRFGKIRAACTKSYKMCMEILPNMWYDKSSPIPFRKDVIMRFKFLIFEFCFLLLLSVCTPYAQAAEENVLYEFNCSAEWVAEHREGTDYAGVFFGEGGGLGDYYFIKFNQATLGKNFVYIGNYDLSEVRMISFEVTNGGESIFKEHSRLVLAANKDGDTVLAEFPAIAGTGWSTPMTSSALVETNYSGPLYAIFINDGATDGYQVDHFRFYSAAEGFDRETDIETDDGHTLPVLYRFRASLPWFLSLSKEQMKGVQCGTSGVDQETCYLKFNMFSLDENYVYIGDMDLTEATALSYLVTNGGGSQFGEGAAIRLSADPAGEEIILTSKAIAAVGWDTPRIVIEFFNTDYCGPLYISFVGGGSTDGYQVADFSFFAASSTGEDITILPAETLPETRPETEGATSPSETKAETETKTEAATGTPAETGPKKASGGCRASAGIMGAFMTALAAVLLKKRSSEKRFWMSACVLALCLCLCLSGCAPAGANMESDSLQETSDATKASTDEPAESSTESETTPSDSSEAPVNSRELLTFTPAVPEGQVLTADGNSPQILIHNYNESAIDALGRSLPTSAETGLPKENKYVGLFYFIWASEGGTVQTNSNITEILACNPDNPNYGGIGHFNWWAQPETGYRRSNDEWVIKRDMYYFSMAGVDFIYLDLTNGFLYENGLTALLDTCLALREAGIMTPYIVPWAHGTRDSQVGDMGDLYENFYKNEKYNDLWFRWDGKPLAIIRHDLNDQFPILEDSEMTDYFSFRIGWSDKTWPGERKGYGKWDDNHVVNYGYTYGWWDNPREAECVAIGTAGFANYGSGRSGALSAKPYVDRFGCTDTMGEGLVLEDAFRQVMEKNPETQVLLLSRWNESGAQFYGANDFGFVDQYSPEFSRDMEPVKGLFGDNYFYQMCSIIRRFKGVLPADGNTGKVTVDMHGDFDQWQAVLPVFTDFEGDTSVRDCYDTTGTVRHVNRTGRNDIVESRMTADSGHLYVYARTAGDITAPDGASNWMLLFLDTDNNKSTGFEGYDVLVGNRVVDGTCISLSVWRENVWQEVGFVHYRMEKNQLMLAIPRSLINLTGAEFTVNFHWLDNVSDIYDLNSWFLTGDSAPERRNNYTLSLAVPYDKDAAVDRIELEPEAAYTCMPAVTPEAADALTPGLSMTYYLLPRAYGVQPTFDFIDDLAAVTTHVPTVGAQYGIRYADYALLFEGYVKVEASDTYTFSLICDDGAKLYIDGRLVVDGAYDGKADTSGTAHTYDGSIRLASGYHTIRIEYAESVGNGGAYLDLTCDKVISLLG